MNSADKKRADHHTVLASSLLPPRRFSKACFCEYGFSIVSGCWLRFDLSQENKAWLIFF